MGVLEEVRERLHMGKEKYGHGVRADDDTTTWGTNTNSWLEMAKEEFLDAIVYVIADYIRYMRRTDESFPKENIDDNDLILKIFKNFESIKSPRHKMLIWNLENMCRLDISQ